MSMIEDALFKTLDLHCEILKYDDIIDLLHCIPPIRRNYFKSRKLEKNYKLQNIIYNISLIANESFSISWFYNAKS